MHGRRWWCYGPRLMGGVLGVSVGGVVRLKMWKHHPGWCSASALCLFSIQCIFLILSVGALNGDAEVFDASEEEDSITWCTINIEEQYKCGNLSLALVRDRLRFGKEFYIVKCKQGFDKDECMTWIGADRADITSLDSGSVFEAGRFHSLVPFMQEEQKSGLKFVFSVAVVKKGSSVGNGGLRSLRGVKACFPAVNTLAGWVIPIKTLMADGGLEVIDCNNHVKSVINFFGPSCAPNSLLDKNNPIGDNSDKLCHICSGRVGKRCTSSDPYAGYTGALRCLLESGDIAFLKHSTIPFALLNHREFSSIPSDRFELLCKDGSRRPINEYEGCNWGRAPSNAIITSSAKTEEQIKRYQKFLTRVVQYYANQSPKSNLTDSTRPVEKDQFGYPIENSFRNTDRDQYGNPIARDQFGNPIVNRDRFGNPIINRDKYGNPITNPYDYGGNTTTDNYSDESGQPIEKFDLFNSNRHGVQTDLLLEDSTVSLLPLGEEKQSYTDFLGQAEKLVLQIRECPVRRFTLCVTSEAEHDKCVKMRTAMKAQLLKPDMACYKGRSQINCMQAIRGGTADGVMLEAADIWEAARHYSLQPFISEVYGHGQSSYYAVAVAKEQDADTELTYLRDKNTCHSGISTAAGWVYPLAYLISNGWIRPYGCDAARAAAEWFARSCAPGATSPEYNNGVPHAPLCRLCHGSTYSFCRRDASEAYFGDIGAIRCLVEGGGDVAFVRHSAVAESAGGRKAEWWARNTLLDDFQLLCPDGTRGQMADYKKCNLGLVSANAMVTRGGDGLNETEVSAYTNLFLYAQQFYGTKTDDDFSFSMFSSPPPYYDLIFTDGTRQLRALQGANRRASHYLGKVFLRAHRLTDCDPTTSGSGNLASVKFLTCFSTLIYLLINLSRS